MRRAVGKAKIAITLAEKTVKYLDQLVEEQVFANRSQAIQKAVDEKLERMGRDRLARECAKLDPAEEKRLAEESLAEDLSKWPEY